MMDDYYWDYWHEFSGYISRFTGWYGEDSQPLALCDGKEMSSDNRDESYPLEGYSYPVIAIDHKGKPHIAVGVSDYRKDEAEFYFRDAYTGEELDVIHWKYIHR